MEQTLNQGVWGDIHGKTCPFGAKSGIFFCWSSWCSALCAQAMGRPRAAARVDGERREELFWEVVYGSNGGLWLVFVGVLCSRAVTIHGESTFLLLLESQNHSIAQVGRDPKDHGVPAPRVPGLKAWKSSLAFSLQIKVDFSIP